MLRLVFVLARGLWAVCKMEQMAFGHSQNVVPKNMKCVSNDKNFDLKLIILKDKDLYIFLLGGGGGESNIGAFDIKG